jgi:hypothetical protein
LKQNFSRKPFLNIFTVKKIYPEPLWYTENPLSVRNLFKDSFIQPFTELNYPSLVAGRTKVTAFARKMQ